LFSKNAAINNGIVSFFAAGKKILEYLDIKEQKLLSCFVRYSLGVSAVSIFFNVRIGLLNISLPKDFQNPALRFCWVPLY
jgi:hypothetical protein